MYLLCSKNYVGPSCEIIISGLNFSCSQSLEIVRIYLFFFQPAQAHYAQFLVGGYCTSYSENLGRLDRYYLVVDVSGNVFVLLGEFRYYDPLIILKERPSLLSPL